jgi:hypothetical protein
MTDNIIYLPWSWTITSADTDIHSCPSVSGILSTFAIVNGVVCFVSIVFGHRNIVKITTCGCLGKAASKSWIYLWTVPIILNLAANVLIAFIIKRSSGYNADFEIWELMLFLLARPRLSWIILGFFAGRARKMVSVPVKRKKLIKHNGQYERLGYVEEITLHPEYNSSTTSIVRKQYDWPWMNAFLSQFIAEVLMQLAALYVMGRTVRFAIISGFYNVHKSELYNSLPPGAHMMYAGAMYYLIGGSIALVIAIICIGFQFAIAKGDQMNSTRAGIIRYLCVFLLLATTFLGSWLFWAGFVQLAGDLYVTIHSIFESRLLIPYRYCPPKLASHAIIWTLFSAVGVFLGAGV